MRNYAFSSSRWRLAAAFISGMVLTAAAVPTLVFLNEHTHGEVIAPVPENAPKLFEPVIFPGKSPVVNQITELVYAFSEEAPILS